MAFHLPKGREGEILARVMGNGHRRPVVDDRDPFRVFGRLDGCRGEDVEFFAPLFRFFCQVLDKPGNAVDIKYRIAEKRKFEFFFHKKNFTFRR